MEESFSGLTLEELEISEWSREIIVPDAMPPFFRIALFWQPIAGVEPAFEFHCVEWFQSDFDFTSHRYATLFSGTVYFDGVRHIYFGNEKTDNYGYLYYCDIPGLISSLKRLDDLQVSRCECVRMGRE